MTTEDKDRLTKHLSELIEDIQIDRIDLDDREIVDLLRMLMGFYYKEIGNKTTGSMS